MRRPTLASIILFLGMYNGALILVAQSGRKNLQFFQDSALNKPEADFFSSSRYTQHINK